MCSVHQGQWSVLITRLQPGQVKNRIVESSATQIGGMFVWGEGGVKIDTHNYNYV
jgi:hypothetical protein